MCDRSMDGGWMYVCLFVVCGRWMDGGVMNVWVSLVLGGGDVVMRWWRTCVVVMCAVEQRGGEVTRLEPQDLSVTVELGLCLCSRLPGKIDNQTEVTRRQIQ